MSEFKDYQLGNFLFHLQSSNYYQARLAADQWAYYIQHNMPITQGLDQQISTCQIPFPTRLIPTVREEIVIPAPTFHSPYIPDNSTEQVFSWPLDPLPRSYMEYLPESTRTTTIPSYNLPPLPDPRQDRPRPPRCLELKKPFQLLAPPQLYRSKFRAPQLHPSPLLPAPHSTTPCPRPSPIPSFLIVLNSPLLPVHLPLTDHESPISQPTTPIIQTGGGRPLKFELVWHQPSLDGYVQDAKFVPTTHPHNNLAIILAAIRATIKPLLEEALKSNHGLSFWVSLQVKYMHPSKEITNMQPPFLHSGKKILLNETELDTTLDEITQSLFIRKAHFNLQNSGLVLEDILNFRFKISVFNPLVGLGYKELPQFLAKKHSIINVQNTDERCFGFAILSALHPVPQHAERAAKYHHLFHQYQLDTIRYPVSIADIPPIEDMLQVNINVYGFYDGEGKSISSIGTSTTRG